MHNISLVRELGCGTCDPRRIDKQAIRSRLRLDRCFFLQNAADFVRELPLGAHSPAIVHGFDNDALAGLFRRHAHHELTAADVHSRSDR